VFLLLFSGILDGGAAFLYSVAIYIFFQWKKKTAKLKYKKIKFKNK